MKNLKLTSLLCGGVLSLTATSALAQQSSSAQQSTSPSSSSAPSSSQYGTSSQQQQGGSYGSASQSQSGTHSLGSSSSSLDASRSSMQSGNNVRLSQIMHKSVQSQEGKTLGQIRDLIVDPQSGRIEFAVLSLSNAGGASDTSTSGRETVPSSRSSVSGTPSTLGAGAAGKLIPVPWQLFSQSFGSSTAGTGTSSSSAMGAQNLVLNLDESKLRTAPSFDSGDWNQLQSGNLDQRVYSHFGVDRSSATGTSGSSISGQGAGETSGSSLGSPQGSSSSQGSSPQGSSSQGSSSQGGSTTGPQR